MNKDFKTFFKSVWLILAVGILLRIILSLTTFHPDIRAFNLGGHLIATGNILNLYDYLSNCAPESLYPKVFGWDLFIYPPAIYLFHGFFNFIFSSIFGQNIMNGFIIENADNFKDINFNLHLLLLKLPYFLFDLPAAFIIAQLFEEKRQRLLAFILWLFNPVTLYSTYMMGQFDMIPAAFTILALFFAQRKKLYFSALALGIGIAFKLYPIFLLLPLILIAKKWESKILLTIIALIPYALTVAPFLSSHGFRSTALVAGLTQKTLYAQIPISGGESLLLFPLIVGFFYTVFIHLKNSVETLWMKQLIILLVFFILTHFHPQWLSWLTPFLIVELVHNYFKNLKSVILMLVSFLASLFFFDLSLTLKIFAPLYPYLNSLPIDINGFLGLHLDINLIRSVLQTIFSSAALFLIYLYFSKPHTDK